jgi:hypothetical protein
MNVYYRISDKGNPKEKIPRGGKRECLENAIAEFGLKSIHVIADNCSGETVSFLRELGLSFEETSLGNSGSFIYLAEKIASIHQDRDKVYLLEDDYIHLGGSRALLDEGLEIADYVTLYDHPDKYKLETERGNPHNHGNLHPVRLFVTAHSHWRTTDSTTMTFACRAGVLRDDLPVWHRFTKSRNPDDFHGFMTLTNNSLSDALSFLFRRRKREFKIIFKNWLFRKHTRILVSAVPARSTHAELAWLAPVIDWRQN